MYDMYVFIWLQNVLTSKYLDNFFTKFQLEQPMSYSFHRFHVGGRRWNEKKIVPLAGNTSYQGFWIYLYFRIRHSFAHLRPVILSADWSISRLQSWTCSSLSTVAEFVKLTQSIVIEIQRQSADLYKVQLCNWQLILLWCPQRFTW